jgi:hypothetical protein
MLELCFICVMNKMITHSNALLKLQGYSNTSWLVWFNINVSYCFRSIFSYPKVVCNFCSSVSSHHLGSYSLSAAVPANLQSSEVKDLGKENILKAHTSLCNITFRYKSKR